MRPLETAPIFPKDGYVRIHQIIGKPPEIPAFLPFGRTTFYALIKSGIAPKPLKVSPRISLWDAAEIRQLADRLAAEKIEKIQA
jgi:prophage regulatory protein